MDRYLDIDTTGLVYTKYSPSSSCIILKSSSINRNHIEAVAARPLFHGNSFHTAPTGTFVPKMKLIDGLLLV